MAEEARNMECPGCGVQVPRTLVACKTCWHKLPSEMRSAIYRTKPHGINRMREIGKARLWLAANR